MNQIKKFNYLKLKNIILFILLGIWILIPILKEIKITSVFIAHNEYNYMKILATIGIYLIIFDMYKKIKSSENRKNLIKELLPIFILLIYLIWTLISAIFAKNKYFAFFGTSYRKDGFITYLIYAGFFACAFLLDSKKMQKYLLNIFILVGCFTIIFIEMANNRFLYNIFNFNDIEKAVFSNSNHYGYYLLLVLVTTAILFITEKKKVNKSLYLVSYIFIMYYFIKNNTFGCYIAFAVMIIIYFSYSIYIKKDITSSVVCLVIFIIMSFVVQINGQSIVAKNVRVLFSDIGKILNIDISKNNISSEGAIDKNLNSDEIENNNLDNIDSGWEKAGSGRAELWKYGIQLFLEKPILGYGPENLEQEYARFNIDQDRPHNLIIQLATTSGIIGLLLYCTSIGIIIIRGIKKIREKESIGKVVLFVVIAYLISAMFGNSMYYTSPYFFIFLGWLMKDNIRDKYI